MSKSSAVVPAILLLGPVLCGGALADPAPLWSPDYVRLDLGHGWQDTGGFRQHELQSDGGRFTSEVFKNSFIAGAGLGWRLSDTVRFDITGEYRFKTDVAARDWLEATTPLGSISASTLYETEYSALVGLANFYVDLPRAFERVTPYLGAGIGVAHNRFSRMETASQAQFVDTASGAVSDFESPGQAGGKAVNELAWALMAGATIDLGGGQKLDFGYRYLDLGGDVSARSSTIVCDCGTTGRSFIVPDLHAHELRIGFRWDFSGFSEGNR